MVIVDTGRRVTVVTYNINKLFLYEEYLNTVVIRGIYSRDNYRNKNKNKYLWNYIRMEKPVKTIVFARGNRWMNGANANGEISSTACKQAILPVTHKSWSDVDG